MSRQKRVHNFLERMGQGWNDVSQGFSRGFAPASEDARSVLYKYRESIGLDEPPQAAEVASRSGLLQALRDGVTAQGAPDPIGFSDGMLKERLEVGQNILDDPSIFQRALEDERNKKYAARRQGIEDGLREGKISLQDIDVNTDFGGSIDDSPVLKNFRLSSDEEGEVIHKVAKDVKRQMRETSVLKKLGYNLGAVAGDINEDRSRSLYWLLNAPQAVTATSADLLMSSTSPNLRSMRSITRQDLARAEQAGLLRKVGNKPLAQGQIDAIRKKNPSFFKDDANALEESIKLNLDNYEPAQPGIRKKFDKKADNIFKQGAYESDDDRNLGDSVFGQRRISASTLAALGLGGTALATNAGLGLMGTESTGIPLVGRREGYAAASPDEIDPRQSNNIAFEVGTRYLLSRDGRMLPKADFLLERPDVNAKDYTNYNAYMFDKELDLNPFDDGKTNLGIIKTNTDGIHGGEVQILGQTLSANEAGIPLLGAMGGMAAGALLPNMRQVRLQNQRSSWRPGKGKRGIIKNIMGYMPEVRAKRYDREQDTNPNNPLLKNKTIDKATQAIEDFFLTENKVTQKTDMDRGRVLGALAGGSFGGMALGTVIGLEREDRRRRENFAEDNPGINYDVYKTNAKNLLDQKYELMASDPDRTEKQEKSKTGFNRVSQQEGLMNYMQKQQAALDSVADAYLRSKGQESLDKQEWALGKISEIEKEKNRRKEDEPYPLI